MHRKAVVAEPDRQDNQPDRQQPAQVPQVSRGAYARIVFDGLCTSPRRGRGQDIIGRKLISGLHTQTRRTNDKKKVVSLERVQPPP